MDERRYVEAEEVAEIVEEIDPNGVTPRVGGAVGSPQAARLLAAGGPFGAARRGVGHDVPDRTVAHSVPRQPADRLPRRAGVGRADQAPQGPSTRSIWRAKAKRNAAFTAPCGSHCETPLDFVEHAAEPDHRTIISEEYDIPIIFDTTALDAVAASPDVEVTIQISNVIAEVGAGVDAEERRRRGPDLHRRQRSAADHHRRKKPKRACR